MPWCPKCKNEYKEGVTVCVDCGTELVNEQPELFEYSPLYTLEKKEVADKLIKYFEYSKIESHYEYDEKENGYVIYVRDDEMKKAKKQFAAFYTVELEQTAKDELSKQMETTNEESEDPVSEDEFEEAFEEAEEEKKHVSKMMYDGGAYEKKSDKAKDLKSTTITFFAFGVIGLVFVLLNIIGVIEFIGGPLQYVIMVVLFIGFLLVGINSLQRYKKTVKDSVLEEDTTKKINEWLESTVTKETLNELADSSLSKEANFIRVMDGIKALVEKQFGELDDAYLDYVTEEYYNNKFGEDSFSEDEF